MSDERRRVEPEGEDEHKSNHPFAVGVLTGAAVGVGLGMLVAPRKGSELREQMGTQLTKVKSSCASGLNRAKDTAADLGHKGRDAYNSTRDFVVKGAHETQRYVSEVADAVTMKARRLEARASQPKDSVSMDAGAATSHERIRSTLTAHSR